MAYQRSLKNSFLGALVCIPFFIFGQKEFVAASFMFTRPIYCNIAAQRSLFHTFAECPPGPIAGVLQIMPMYQQSASSAHAEQQAARYFFINHKSTLLVQGDEVPNSQVTRDVRAEWFQLSSQYNGTITIAPSQQQFCTWIEYQQSLSHYFANPWLQALWLTIAAPIQYIKNNLQCTQTVLAPSGQPGVQTMQEAFIRPDLTFGKIGPAQHAIALANCMIKLGMNMLEHDGFEIDVYGHGIFPFYGAQNPEFLFAPMIGANSHVIWGMGVDLQLPLNDCTQDHIFAFFCSIQNDVFIHRSHKRILEIKEKQWSRYLLLNSKDGELNIPAANILTRHVEIKPHNHIDLATGLRWYNDCIEAEIGYSLWAHGTEKIKLNHDWPEKYGIAGTGTFIDERGLEIGTTASKSTINFQAANDVDANGNPVFVPIVRSQIEFLVDLDRFVSEGGAFKAFANRIHASCGWRNTNTQYAEGFVGAGAFFEIPSTNASLSNWGLWVKGGISI